MCRSCSTSQRELKLLTFLPDEPRFQTHLVLLRYKIIHNIRWQIGRESVLEDCLDLEDSSRTKKIVPLALASTPWPLLIRNECALYVQ